LLQSIFSHAIVGESTTGGIMFGWLFIKPEDELIDIQARIDAIENMIALFQGSTLRQREDLEKLYYQRNKINASNK
jgi:hypothetical protein